MGYSRAEVENLLKENGWTPTVGAPRDVIDWQRTITGKPYNRIILWECDLDSLTVNRLNYMMSYPPDKR